ncbi:MAG TPA: PAS domain-containing protein, partial [Chloroflexota bacterium]
MARPSTVRSYLFGLLDLIGGGCIVAAAVQHSKNVPLLAAGAVLLLIGIVGFVRQQQKLARELVKRQTEDAARLERERRFRKIVNASTFGLFLTDLEGRLVQVNGSLQAMLGYSEVEMLGKTPGDFTLRNDVALDAALFR